MRQFFSEDEVHQYIWATGLADLMDEGDWAEPPPTHGVPTTFEDVSFELWRVIRRRAVERIRRLHHLISRGEIIGSRLSLPIAGAKATQLDFLGTHDEGLFVLELKMKRSAERNAFSELFAYSNYVAGAFALSGRKDVTNVLVAPMLNEITGQAYLYDLLVNDRDVIVYRPDILGDDIGGLRLQPLVPDDDVFRVFANHLLSHEAMSCVVLSFADEPGWGAEETGADLSEKTLRSLTAISSHAAQLMEAESLHGFCFARKRWSGSVPDEGNSLIVCALNPFRFFDRNRVLALSANIGPNLRDAFVEGARSGFRSRLANIAERTFQEAIGHRRPTEVEFASWEGMLGSFGEIIQTCKIGFRPTGLLREAYTSFTASVYARNQEAARRIHTGRRRHYGYPIEMPALQIDALHDWSRAWDFMEICGLGDSERHSTVGRSNPTFSMPGS